MKKFYLLFSTFVALITTNVSAQCPNPNGFAFPFNYSAGCYVFVTTTLPNADINVYNGIIRINTTEGQTDQFGQGTAFYDCSQTITRVVLTRVDGTVCEIPGDRIAAPATLPVKLSDFKAQIKGNNASLEWISEFEIGSEKFVVQRSLDGVNYTSIGEVDAAKNSTQTRRYTFDDVQLGERAAYYRLQMVDLDGKIDLSKTVYINNKRGAVTGSGTFKVFPNPFRADMQIVGINASDVNRRSIRLYNVAGKEIGFTITGANAITVDASAPRGIYILRVMDKTFKLVKE